MGIDRPSGLRSNPDAFDDAGVGPLVYRFPSAVDAASATPIIRRWGENLKVFEAELEKASAQADGEFLGIASKLDDFYSRAINISSMSSAAAGLLKGGEIRMSVTGLKDMLDDVRSSVEDSEHEIGRFVDGFSEILSAVGKMRERLGNIGFVCRGLRKHSTTMKIYSAQLAMEDADFGSLAEDVKKLSERMEVRTSSIDAELAVLSSQVSQTIADVRHLGEKHRFEINGILRNMAASVASLNRRHDSAAAAAVGIKEVSREISDHIGHIVSSVQFHDITNQQIQRAKDRMSNLGAALDRVASAGDIPERSDLLKIVNAVGFACGIQADHLSSAEGELNRAAKEIVFDLEKIADSVSKMSRMVAETSLDSGGSLLEDIKNGLNAVSAAFYEITENKKEFSGAAEAAMLIERKILSFMKDIEEIGEDIDIIALNAGVKAAQIGNRGTAVSVIVNSMQSVLAEAQGLTDTFLECRFSFDPGDGESGDVDVISNNLKSLLGSINEVDEDLSEVIRGMRSESRKLYEDISDMTEGLSVHERLSGSIGRVVNGMLGIARECEPFFPAGHFSAKNPDWELLEAQLNGLDSVPDAAISSQRVQEHGGTVEFF